MNNNDFNNNSYSSPNQNVGNGYIQQPTNYQQAQQPVQPQMDTGYTQPTIQNLNSNHNPNITTLKKENKNIKKILLIVIAILAIGGIAFTGYKFFFKDKIDNKEFDIKATTSFFLQNSDSKYALFNETGEQLTDFIYTRVGDFVNGTARVEIDDQEGIINAYGKMTVPLGKYKYITPKSGLYRVNEDTKESYNKYLINGEGKVLYNLDGVNVDSFIGIDTFLILELENENKYKVINYGGKELVSFPKVDDDDVKSPSVNEEQGHISVFYNNKNWIFNVSTGKQLASFDSNLHYCVNNVSEDGTIVTLNSCVSWFQSQDKTYYKFIKDGKLYDKTGECDRIRENQGNIFCTKDNKDYLLDSSLNLGIETNGKAYSNASNSYVMASTKENYTVDFYQNGKLSKSVPCRDLEEQGYMESDIYLLGTHYNTYCGTDFGKYEYYNSKGEKIINKSFVRAEPFDSNGLARVSEDKKTYYMIDKKGKQVGGSYSNIYLYAGFYTIINNDLEGIMNKEGKEIIPTSYSKISISTHKGRTFATSKTSENKYIVYDLDKNKELFSVDVAPTMNYEHYITTYSNGKTQYYTFDGKMFFEK